jgi:hypothetical protein
MRRREFLILAGASALAQTPSVDAKLARIGVSTWSFHTLFPNDSAKPAKPLDLLEFPEMIADRYRVHNLEVIAPHFASTESSIFAIPARFETGAFTIGQHPDRYRRAVGEALALVAGHESLASMRFRFTRNGSTARGAGIALGYDAIRAQSTSPICRRPSLLTNSGAPTLAPKHRPDRTRITERFGASEELAAILKASGAGALPDFGNFPGRDTRERG